jgi:hypothetical protein
MSLDDHRFLDKRESFPVVVQFDYYPMAVILSVAVFQA